MVILFLILFKTVWVGEVRVASNRKVTKTLKRMMFLNIYCPVKVRAASSVPKILLDRMKKGEKVNRI